MKMNKRFGNIEFGSVKYNLSHLGIAVENAAGEMSPINWHNLEVRYINKHGKAGARRKKIISSNPEMLRKFKNAVDVMMVG